MIRARNIPHERHARSKYRSNDDKVPAEHMSLFSGNKQVPHILHALHAPPRARRPRPHIRPTYLLPTTRIPPASAGGPHPHRSAPPLTSPARHRLFEVPPTHDSAPLPSPCSLKSPATHTFFFVGLTKGRTAEAVEARRGQFSTSRSRWVVSDTIGTVPRLLVLRFT